MICSSSVFPEQRESHYGSLFQTLYFLSSIFDIHDPFPPSCYWFWLYKVPSSFTYTHTHTHTHTRSCFVYFWSQRWAGSGKSKVAPVLYLSTTPWKRIGRVEVQLHSLFYLGTRWRWVVSFTSRPLYPQSKSSWYPLYRRLGGLQSRSGRGGEEKNSKSSPGIEP
jgi:hypothetical protein